MKTYCNHASYNLKTIKRDVAQCGSEQVLLHCEKCQIRKLYRVARIGDLRLLRAWAWNEQTGKWRLL